MIRYLLAFVLCLPLCANTVVSGTVVTPLGTSVTGVLTLYPPTNVQLTRACGGSGGAYSPQTITIAVSSGTLSTNPNMVGNDCLLPNNTTYTATFVTGGIAYTAQWYIFGTSFSTSAQVFGGTASITGMPTGTQVINQPSGSSLYVNRLILTQLIALPVGNGAPSGTCINGSKYVQLDAASQAWEWVCIGNAWVNETGGGGGGGVASIFHGTLALGVTKVDTGTCDSPALTVTATGVLATDNVNATFNADPTSLTGFAASTMGGLFVYVWPTTNTINVKRCNNTTADITPQAATVNLQVVR